MRFIIALQFWEQDKVTAMRLARLIADIEPARRDDVEFIFVARFDCEHDHETIAYVGRKFLVNWTTSHTRWMGWPGGCNGCAIDTLQWIATNRKDAVGVLMLEPDCVPCGRLWLNRIMHAWKNAIAQEKWLMGAWRPSGGQYGHVNGVGVFRVDLGSLIPLQSIVSQDLAWDAAISYFVKDRWQKSGIIKNCFRSTGATEDDLRTPDMGLEPPALVHGYKDTTAEKIALQWAQKE